MTIEDGKAALEFGHTLELDLPKQGRYLAATYHALMNEQKQYTYSVYYEGVSIKWEMLFASVDWSHFFSRLPSTLQASAEWVIL
jgi:hypothetical protein